MAVDLPPFDPEPDAKARAWLLKFPAGREWLAELEARNSVSDTPQGPFSALVLAHKTSPDVVRALLEEFVVSH